MAQNKSLINTDELETITLKKLNVARKTERMISDVFMQLSNQGNSFKY